MSLCISSWMCSLSFKHSRNALSDASLPQQDALLTVSDGSCCLLQYGKKEERNLRCTPWCCCMLWGNGFARRDFRAPSFPMASYLHYPAVQKLYLETSTVSKKTSYHQSFFTAATPTTATARPTGDRIQNCEWFQFLNCSYTSLHTCMYCTTE